VWVDVIQLGVYLLGGIATLIVAHAQRRRYRSIRARVGRRKTCRSGFSAFLQSPLHVSGVGWWVGALLAAASHGTDHLIVQRLLAARGLRDAQRATDRLRRVHHRFSSALFLLVGNESVACGRG